ncbi:MAG: response regulator [Deltaproteobacteria bacterium]|nr:response regulator [Deltaproteobacteria bacterium]
MSKKRILIIDDEPDLVEVLRDGLEAQGYIVTTAGDGEAGLAAARTDSPNAILLDIAMPKIDGYEVCRLLKADPVLGKIPIIMISAKAQAEDIRQGKAAGADEYLPKPLQMRGLLKTLAAFATA